jgi:hypothetical protein
MADGLERIWKDMVMALSRYYGSVYLEGRDKTTKTSVMRDGVLAASRTKDIVNTNLEH